MVGIVMVGIAPTDLEVSQYITELNAYPLLTEVTLKYSIRTDVEGTNVREFRVEMKLNPAADVRAVDPLIMPREALRNPLSNEMLYTFPGEAPPAGTEPAPLPGGGE
jgi:hypothetical protein